MQTKLHVAGLEPGHVGTGLSASTEKDESRRQKRPPLSDGVGWRGGVIKGGELISAPGPGIRVKMADVGGEIKLTGSMVSID